MLTSMIRMAIELDRRGQYDLADRIDSVRIAMRPFRQDDVRDPEAYQTLRDITGDPNPIQHISPGRIPHIVTPYVGNAEGDANGIALTRANGPYGMQDTISNLIWKAARGPEAGNMMLTRKTGGGIIPHEMAHFDQDQFGVSANDIRNQLGKKDDPARGFFWAFAPNEIRAQVQQIVHLIKNNQLGSKPNLPDKEGYQPKRMDPEMYDRDDDGNVIPPTSKTRLNVPRRYLNRDNRYVLLRSGVHDYDLVDTVLRAAKEHGWEPIINGDEQVINEIIAQQQLSVLGRSRPEHVSEEAAISLMPRTKTRDDAHKHGLEMMKVKSQLRDLSLSDDPILREMGKAALMGNEGDILAAQKFAGKAIRRIDPRDLIPRCTDLIRMGGFRVDTTSLRGNQRFVDMAERSAKMTGVSVDESLIATECGIPDGQIVIYREAYDITRDEYGEDMTPEDMAGVIQLQTLKDAPNDHFVYLSEPFLVGRPGQEQRELMERNRPQYEERHSERIIGMNRTSQTRALARAVLQARYDALLRELGPDDQRVLELRQRIVNEGLDTRERVQEQMSLQEPWDTEPNPAVAGKMKIDYVRDATSRLKDLAARATWDEWAEFNELARSLLVEGKNNPSTYDRIEGLLSDISARPSPGPRPGPERRPWELPPPGELDEA